MAETIRSALDKTTLKFVMIACTLMFGLLSWAMGLAFNEGLAYLKRIDDRFEALTREYSAEFHTLKIGEATTLMRVQQIEVDVKEIKTRLNQRGGDK